MDSSTCFVRAAAVGADKTKEKVGYLEHSIEKTSVDTLRGTRGEDVQKRNTAVDTLHNSNSISCKCKNSVGKNKPASGAPENFPVGRSGS